MRQTDTRVEQEQTKTGSRVIPFSTQLSDTMPYPINLPDNNPYRLDVESPITEQLNMEQLTELVQQLVQVAIDATQVTANDDDDNWSLNSGQMLFMLRHNNLFQDATNDDDIEQVRALAASDEFKALFGIIGIDEAYDRYLTTLEEGRA